MRFCHIADLHFRKEFYNQIKASIDTIISEHGRDPFDVIVIAGDTWDGPVQNTAGSMFAAFLDLVKRLADCAPVAMIYGTPSHDAEGSLEVFEQIEAAHGITILRPGKAYFLNQSGSGDFIYDHQYHQGLGDVALLLGVPEPNKKWLLADGGATGKDATDEAVREAMGALFLGLGGKRKEHPDLPCLLLYHGQVVGAKSSTGYTAGSGIAVTRDQLAYVGADYYALGDIHLPQQIGDLPAYYPGKIYTGDWNEQGYVPGANVVEIGHRDGVKGESPLFDEPEGFKTEISRLDFPHPKRTKIDAKASDPIPLASEGLVWLEITATKDEAADIDTDELTARLIGHGALSGSQVTVKQLPTETVRAAEIVEKEALDEKAQVWGDNSEVEIPEGVKQKARELEREAKARGFGVVTEKRFRNVSTFIRGAWGFFYNQKKDEVFIEWEKMGSGTVAYVGPNGFGKTTSIDFSKPWPVPVSRPPKTLAKHFRLRDSVIENEYLEEVSGIRFKSVINIAATLATPTAEYYLYQDTGAGWEPYSGINGRLEPYDSAVAEVFGSLLMYMRTAFAMQTPSSDYPDVSRTTREERKALVSELAGKDFSDLQEAAKTNADGIEGEIVRVQAVIDAAEDVDETIARLQVEASSALGLAADGEKEASAIEERGLRLKAEREAAGLRVAELDRRQQRRAHIERDISELTNEIDAAMSDVASFREAAAGRGDAETELNKIETLEAERSLLRKEKAAIDDANHAELISHQKVIDELTSNRRTAQSALDAARNRKATAEREAAVARARLAAPIQDHCPTCAQLLPEEKRAHLQEERAKLEAEIARLSSAVEAAQEDERSAESMLSSIVTPDAPVPLPFEGSDRLAALDRELAFADADAYRDIIRRAAGAEVRIEGAEKAAAEKRERIAKLTDESSGLTTDEIEAERSRLVEIEHQYEDARREYTEATNAVASARASAEAAQRAIADAEKRKAARVAAEAELGNKRDELAEWRLLERAIRGVRDLELDALAPSIADIATTLLQSSGYPGRFRIDTTKISGKGSKTKQIEDFLIFYEGEAGEKEISVCSGGEMVWIRKAIYDAFAVIRAKNAGIKWTTVFLDETDGALFPADRMAYFRMLEAAHVSAGRFQTVLITQSSEVAAMATQTLDVTKLECRPAAEVAE
jgi:DNA repair exonuclease SbcCD nuclease subunit